MRSNGSSLLRQVNHGAESIISPNLPTFGAPSFARWPFVSYRHQVRIFALVLLTYTAELRKLSLNADDR